ncbi:SDR family NAD(P)-dependent oxidoreductase [Parvibaculum sp.]|uniref:SDR family NAD(P)-dependent oxidoreductase n=1 Tax=Parvibaculum sp. TaxID=2024848 RepID=UPI001E13E1FE|nr:SDR family NAD(P)-dependent oxidoreductase [Parvibaculum sp.]MBX3490285.1 SDR family NAD(P)-dependent oxidoreductase [Parvibaculum sp.]MCW5728212.1 SDR family NAD(P)-dependent oxidoreductase [Parvibaculum sp.]
MNGTIKDVVWITGASSGIGRALALRMAKAGYRVAATARRAGELEALAREADGLVVPVAADTTDAASLKAAVTRIEETLGPIGIAVFCAGTYQALMGAELTAAKARPLFELNFMGTVNSLEAVLPGMMRRGTGRIAMVASLAGYFGLPTSAVYGASKAALINMAEALRPDLARHGIAVQIVNPGFVRTPLTDKNEFPMPFLMETADAAEAFYRGLHSSRFEITFPRRFSLLLRLLQMLPYRLSLALTRLTVPKEKSRQAINRTA